VQRPPGKFRACSGGTVVGGSDVSEAPTAALRPLRRPDPSASRPPGAHGVLQVVPGATSRALGVRTALRGRGVCISVWRPVIGRDGAADLYRREVWAEERHAPVTGSSPNRTGRLADSTAPARSACRSGALWVVHAASTAARRMDCRVCAASVAAVWCAGPRRYGRHGGLVPSGW
jgi:hypothetical protein